MTNKRKNNGLTELSDAVAPVRAHHRELIEAASSWLAERGRATDPDHLALVCAGAEYGLDRPGRRRGAPDPVDQDGLLSRAALRHPELVLGQRCPWPLELPQVMWAWFDFLHGTGRLDPTSDPVAELRKPLACFGWLDQDGQPLPPDADRQIPCECLLPYRETDRAARRADPAVRAGRGGSAGPAALAGRAA